MQLEKRQIRAQTFRLSSKAFDYPLHFQKIQSTQITQNTNVDTTD